MTNYEFFPVPENQGNHCADRHHSHGGLVGVDAPHLRSIEPQEIEQEAPNRVNDQVCQEEIARFEHSLEAAREPEQQEHVSQGAIGDFGTFSFQASKLMTAGEGGIIVTNSPELERLARSVHDCGRMPNEWFYSHFIYGSNYRLSEWQGAVLSQQLRRLPQQTAIRTRNAAFLDAELAKIDGITPQRHDQRATVNGHYAYIFHYDHSAFAGVSTERFIQAFNAEGFPTQASYPPLHDMAVFKSGEYRKRLAQAAAQAEHAFLRQGFPNSLRGAWETVWLPQPLLLGDEDDMNLVVRAIQKIQDQAKELV